MRTKWNVVLSVMLVFTLLTGGSAFAFNDLGNTVGKDEILALKDRGIISGTTDKTFSPQGKLSYAQGIALIAKGMDLNTNHMKFVKKPEASDYFKKIPDQAWYAPFFINAHLNGLTLPKGVDPNQTMTREQFANYLIEGLNSTGNYPLLTIWIVINDEKEITTDYLSSIQQAIIMKIVTLDKDEKFNPQRAITRAEAAVMLYRAIDFVEQHTEKNIPDHENFDADVSFHAVPVSTSVNQIVLEWKQAPNSGHRILIERIEFQGKQALVYYSLHSPEPGTMYPQVLTDLKTSTFVDSAYEVQLVQVESFGGTDSTGIIHPETGTSQAPEAPASK